MLQLNMPRKKDVSDLPPAKKPRCKKSAPSPPTTEVLEKIHELALKQVSAQDIATTTGLDVIQIYSIITEHFPHLKDLKLFKEFKSDVYRAIQKKASEWILQKIPVASLKDLTYLVAILEDKINLREGKSTQNIGIGIRIEHLVSEKEKLIGNLRSQGVPEHLLETKLTEMLQLPSSVTIPLQELLPVPEVASTPPPEE